MRPGTAVPGLGTAGPGLGTAGPGLGTAGPGLGTARLGPALPGGGWPTDPATPSTPVALAPGDVPRLAAQARDAVELDARSCVCRACPRLVTWREQVADVRRAAYLDQRYWGRPVPSFGPAEASVLLVGLAPAAHGGNRTGRIFTGDRSGDWLFASLHRVGLASSPVSTWAGDGQRLSRTRITAAVRCAPPGNKPTPAERDACRPWLVRDLELLAPTLRVVVVLGGYAWAALWPALAAAGWATPKPRPTFGHGTKVVLGGVPLAGSPAAASSRGGLDVLGCYHPSQQNTFTGRVTEAMLDAVLGEAARLTDIGTARSDDD